MTHEPMKGEGNDNRQIKSKSQKPSSVGAFWGDIPDLLSGLYDCPTFPTACWCIPGVS